jgi:hypothetical protein
MKNFIEKNFTIIVFIVLILIFFKGCNDSRKLSSLETKFAALKDSIATKNDINKIYEKTDELQNTIYGFGNSFSFVMNKFVDTSIDNKATNKAFDMFSRKAKELNVKK